MTKRRIIAALFSLFLAIIAFAANKDLEKDITMVSYEQRWLDSNGTLALKNNTSDEVKNVVFMISYLDMNGKELDYEEFTKTVSIAPGMTRKLDIPAYEHDRWYHYYKTENTNSESPAFKIKFKLKDYNVKEENAAKSEVYHTYDSPYDDQSSDDGSPYFFIAIFLIILFVSITVGLYILVAVMAKNRNRNVAVWVLLSILATPILTAIILLVVGNDNNRIEHYEP